MSAPVINSVRRHPLSLYSLADDTFRYATEKVITAGYSPIARLAELAVVSALKKIRIGRLRIVTPGKTYEFPETSAHDASTDLSVELRVVSDAFWVRLCTMSDLGFAEAYMYGDVECDDLISTFLIFIRNKENLSGLNSRLSWLFSIPQRLTAYRFVNSLSNSRSNISAHYDMSDDMFKAFLSEDMTYSCAIYSDLDGDLKSNANITFTPSQLRRLSAYRPASSSGSVSSDASPASTPPALSSSFPSDPSTLATPPAQDNLHAAQLRKLTHLTNRARISRGHRVLEIGSGWGAMALHIVRTIPDTQVDTITLSQNQHAHVTGLVAAEGLQDRVRVHLMDYREMPEEWNGAFDRVVSVEMIENVGEENLGEFWRMLDRVMKRKDAAGAVQSITIPEARFDNYRKEVDFIQKWVIFPGGLLPTLTLLLSTMTAATSGQLLVDSVSNIGPHYARTLREWRREFEARFDDTIACSLRREHPGVFEGAQGERELAVFRRKWIFYFCYCEIGFTTRMLGDHIITFTREGNEDFGCDTYE
ncbi:cyclopropane-fatty-acyl-phospholipid synthase [Auriscalpium vulgare]|uniref:Cyclopropane-fatty-acyl-phospholipid synthase n=1 Tax=Auriscalpium vulgare TaxID=40419 RepID=A0ACB8RIN9_9AGAM|nr:cyclopropane-fatty-acyl-phospholipid synthase [Auriscalpium vulgare]